MSRTIVPNSRQARPILIGTALLLTLGMGIRQSFGLFLAPVTHDLAVTAADFTLALAIQNRRLGPSQALVGATADRFGLRITMTAARLKAVGLGIMAAAQGALALIVSGGRSAAPSCTATSLAMTACVRAVTPERRSKMLGLVSAAGSLGTLVMPLTPGPAGARAVADRTPFFTLLAVAMLPAAYWAGGADNIPVQGTATTSMREVLGQAMRNRPFLVMSGAYFVCGLNWRVLDDAFAGLSRSGGQDPMLSAEALAMIGGVSASAHRRPACRSSRDPLDILRFYILRSFVFAAYFMMLPTPTSTLVFAAAMGMLWWPGSAPLIGGLAAEIFGTRYMATPSACPSWCTSSDRRLAPGAAD